MIIRKAKAKDAKVISSYIMLAMNDIIYDFIGEVSYEKATDFLNHLIRQKGNQYSFENCWLAEDKGEIVAAAIVYDGAKFNELRKPVLNTIKVLFNRTIDPEEETQKGEYYIDCAAVSSHLQGKGIGTKMFHFLIDEYVHKRNLTLGLLVDKKNPKARQLYMNLGFEPAGKKTLAGKEMEHLQLKKRVSGSQFPGNEAKPKKKRTHFHQ